VSSAAGAPGLVSVAGPDEVPVELDEVVSGGLDLARRLQRLFRTL